MVSARVRLLLEAGAAKAYVMDNCTQGNFARLVFRVGGLERQCVEVLAVLVGKDDTLAVDAVGADLLGMAPGEVERLRLAAADGLGCIDLESMEIIGDREPFRRRDAPELLPVYPPDVRIFEGEERCCREGCSLNTRMVLQVLYVEIRGRGLHHLHGKGVARGGSREGRAQGAGGGGLCRRGGLPRVAPQAGQEVRAGGARLR